MSVVERIITRMTEDEVFCVSCECSLNSDLPGQALKILTEELSDSAIASWMDKYHEAMVEVERLRGYTKHKTNCRIFGLNSRDGCDCGLGWSKDRTLR